MRLKFYNRLGLYFLGIAAFAAALIAGGGEQANTTALGLTAGLIMLVLDLGCRIWLYRPEDDKVLFLLNEANGGQIALLPVWLWGLILTITTWVQMSILIPGGLMVAVADVVYRLRRAHLDQQSGWLALAPGEGTPLWIIGGLLLLLPWWRALPPLANQVDHQSPFFVCFFALYIAMNLIRRYFASKVRRAGSTTPDVQRSYESPAGLVVLRLLLLSVWVFLLLYGFDQPRMMHFAVPLPDAVRWIGVVVAVASLLLLIWVHQSLGQN